MAESLNRYHQQYIPFTDEQKLMAGNTDLVEFLRSCGEPLKKEGREYRWEKIPGVIVCGNRWYSNYDKEGGYPVKFLQKFFNLDYVEAMKKLLGSSIPLSSIEHEPIRAKQSKIFTLPQKNENMRCVYAYLTKSRFIDSSIISHFANAHMLFEDMRHNAVFVGFNENNIPCSAHKKGTLSEISYRVNVSGSDNRYGFKHVGTSNDIYVFEAPIDLLSFLTLYPDQWQNHSYVALNGVGEHALLQTLEQNPSLKQIYLCLDHDPAGIEACGRLTDILRDKGFSQIYNMLPELKDWNEVLKARNGMDATPAIEHPKAEAMRELCHSIAGETPDTIRPYKRLFELCEKYLQTHDPDQLYPGAKTAVFCVKDQLEKAEKAMTVQRISAALFHSYKPYRDHGSLNSYDKDMVSAIAKVKQELSPSGVYTAKERLSLAQSFLTLAQTCLATRIFHDQQHELTQTLETIHVAM